MHEAKNPAPRDAGSVYLVEDEDGVRRSLALLLRLHGFEVSEFASAEDFLAAAPRDRPACALVDIRLPGMSGLALQARMVHEDRAPPVLLMTAQSDAAIARTALLQGASDFLEKPIDEQELLEAIARALDDDSRRLERSRERDALFARMATLTRRERALFESITDGRQYREIAEQFGVPMEQVEIERTHMMRKLHAQRVADLFRLRFRVDASGTGGPIG